MDGWSFIGLTLVLLVTMGVALGLVVWVGRLAHRGRGGGPALGDQDGLPVDHAKVP